MSHPFAGLPKLPFNTASLNLTKQPEGEDVHKALAVLPEPRKHYKWYYSTSSAASEMDKPKEELHDFLRGYFYLKSADWNGNDPNPLKDWVASELEKLPYYYIMPLNANMRESVKLSMSKEDPARVSKLSDRWLNDKELAVYVQEFGRNGFQGGLNWYRVATKPSTVKELELFAGSKIDVPLLFIAGTQDWGTYQEPGASEAMHKVCSQFRGAKLIGGAGHWVQQERPEELIKQVATFLHESKVESISC